MAVICMTVRKSYILLRNLLDVSIFASMYILNSSLNDSLTAFKLVRHNPAHEMTKKRYACYGLIGKYMNEFSLLVRLWTELFSMTRVVGELCMFMYSPGARDNENDYIVLPMDGA